jgi:hypothetical protein
MTKPKKEEDLKRTNSKEEIRREQTIFVYEYGDALELERSYERWGKVLESRELYEDLVKPFKGAV